MDPVDIQAKLDALLAANPDAQKYVTKLYYVQDLDEVPEDVTHRIQLSSQLSPERALTIGLVAVPAFAASLEAILALIATQPDVAAPASTRSATAPAPRPKPEPTTPPPPPPKTGPTAPPAPTKR